MQMTTLALVVPAAVGLGAILSGLLVRVLDQKAVSAITILGVSIAAVASIGLGLLYLQDPGAFTVSLYTWGLPDRYGLRISFLIDSLTVTMMIVVTVISLLVHIYSIGYMREDAGYVRFFCYLSLFSFAMLLLVMADNFLLLFIGWEGVGLVSYLLIGFWYTRDSAQAASLKAFLVNRVGDLAFLLGLGALLAGVGSLDYATVFAQVPVLAQTPAPVGGTDLLTLACLLLFIGAMGKSAQVPLHVWLPDSMEGPTPISAMIHAATMVTAGIFMVARLSPMFENTEGVLNVILAVGAVTALGTGLMGLVAYDIKRVIAYSTLSQLGYMTVALGASAYAASIFHLFTHAFFKALLFLAAGAVILAMHHEQDIRRMGGLWRRTPVTAATFAIGSLALIGVPGFAGFFSKEPIIEAVQHSTLSLAPFAHSLVLAGVAVTALYSLRLWWYVFQGRPRSPQAEQAKEPAAVVIAPLVVLAVLTLGSIVLTEPFLYGGLLADSLAVAPPHGGLAEAGRWGSGLLAALIHAPQTQPMWVLSGALLLGIVWRMLQHKGRAVLRLLTWPGRVILEQKYGFDLFYERLVPKFAHGVAHWCAQIGDRRLIDQTMVHGVVHLVRQAAARLRTVQTGYLSHYALAMLIGLVAAIAWLWLRG